MKRSVLRVVLDEVYATYVVVAVQYVRDASDLLQHP